MFIDEFRRMWGTRIMDENRKSNSGCGIVSVVQIVLIILKLLKLLDWSWWVIFAPTLVSIGIVLILIIIAVILNCIT